MASLTTKREVSHEKFIQFKNQQVVFISTVLRFYSVEVLNFKGLSTFLWIDACKFISVEESYVEVRGAGSTLRKEALRGGDSSIKSKEISLY